MFDEWKEKRSLRKEIKLLEKEKSELENTLPPPSDDESVTPAASPTYKEIAKIRFKLYNRNRQLAAIETEQLSRKAQKLGIEFPKDKPSWWWDDIDYEGENFRNYLTDMGKAAIKKLIRAERRASADWWVKIILAVLTALTGLVGTIIGVISVLKSNGSK